MIVEKKERERKEEARRQEEEESRRLVLQKEFEERTTEESKQQKADFARTSRLVKSMHTDSPDKLNKVVSVLTNYEGIFYNFFSWAHCTHQFLILGCFSTLRRNLKNQHEGIRSLSERVDRVERNQMHLFSICKDIKSVVGTIAKYINRDNLNISPASLLTQWRR